MWEFDADGRIRRKLDLMLTVDQEKTKQGTRVIVRTKRDRMHQIFRIVPVFRRGAQQ
jgi:hypothetical protein